MITDYIPFLNVPPGEFIKEELEVRDWSQEDLSEVLGVPAKTVSKLVNNKQPINIEMARLLSKAFGQSLNYWINMYNIYMLRELENKNRVCEVELKSDIYSHMPIREMIKKKWLQSFETVYELEEHVLNFFGWDKVDFSQYKKIMPAFRKSEAYENYNTYNALIWYYMAQKMSKRYNVNSYNKDKLLKLSTELHKFTVHPDGVKEFINHLNNVGVKFLILSHLKNTYIDGASFYDNDNPVIVYTKRLNKIDNFWFVVAHEIAHITKHFEKEKDYYFINFDSAICPRSVDIEKEADKFALEVIKEKEIIDFFKHRTYKTHKSILEAEQKLQVCSGIIVGVLQHLKMTSRKNFNKYKHKVSELIPNKYYVENF